MNRALRRCVAAVIAIAVTVPAGATASAETVRVTIEGLRFSPVEVAVRVGDTIEWVNEDFVAHTATARGGAWDVVIPPGEVARLTIGGNAVHWAYFCRFHPQMTGRIAVVAD